MCRGLGRKTPIMHLAMAVQFSSAPTFSKLFLGFKSPFGARVSAWRIHSISRSD